MKLIRETPFKIPPNFNFHTLKIGSPQEQTEKTVRFNQLYDYENVYIEVMHDGKWKVPDEVDYSGAILFSDESFGFYNAGDQLKIRKNN